MSGKNYTLQTVGHDKTTDVKFSGGFLGRLHNVYFQYVKLVGDTKAQELFGHIKEDTIAKIKDDEDRLNAANLETLLILIKEIETAFTKEEKTQMQDVEIPTDESTED